MRCKMECLVTVKCKYSQCKTDDFVFSTEFGRRSACRGPFDHIREPLGAQNAFGCMIYSIFWMHKRAARVDLEPPRECRLATAPPGMFRFREENECFVFLSNRLATLGGLI